MKLFLQHKNIFIFVFLTSALVFLGVVSPSFSQQWYESRVLIFDTVTNFVESPDELEKRLNNDDDIRNPTVQERIQNAVKESVELSFIIPEFMLYGYRFEYIPRDDYRNINEQWIFSPISELSRLDPNLVELNRNIIDSSLVITYRYDIALEQFEWVKFWNNSDVMASGGEGIEFAQGQSQSLGQKAAIIDAFKASIRDRLKKEIANKPLLVKGMILLAEEPFITSNYGLYKAKVKVKIKIEEIKEQQAY